MDVNIVNFQLRRKQGISMVQAVEVPMRRSLLFIAALVASTAAVAAAPVSGDALVKLPAGTLKLSSVQWGEWIADVERPAAARSANGHSMLGASDRSGHSMLGASDRGSVVLQLKAPWPACAVGSRFNGIYLTTGASHRYRLDGARVVRCGPSSVTLNYAKSVRQPL